MESKYKLGLYGWNANGIFIEGKGNFTKEDKDFLEWCMNNKVKLLKIKNNGSEWQVR